MDSYDWQVTIKAEASSSFEWESYYSGTLNEALDEAVKFVEERFKITSVMITDIHANRRVLHVGTINDPRFTTNDQAGLTS